MAWRNAGSIIALRDTVNAQFPRRSKAADGTIGDESHQSRNSDHNAYIKDSRGVGVVRAIDITHDPINGLDSYRLADNLRRIGDPRVRYIISNGRIANPKAAWRKYTGPNPHDHHVHISIVESPLSRIDSQAPWDLGDMTVKPMPGDRPMQPITNRPTLRKGSVGDYVRDLQRLLKITEDGKFGAGTEIAVKAFQSARKLTADGVVGFYTWKALDGAGESLKSASPVLPASNFDRVMEYVFQDEGGMTISADEPGGASNMGVSVQSYAQYLKRPVSITELSLITRDDAKRFYKAQYWDKIGAGKLNTGLGYAAFDFAVNSGTSVVDQIGLDDYLSKAIKEGKTPADQISKLCDMRLAHMQRSPNWPKYKNGWSARVSRVRSRSANLAA